MLNKSCISTAAIVIFAIGQIAQAEITFHCAAGSGTECAFSVIDGAGQGITNFVLGPGQNHGLNDNFAGGHYCVVVSTRPQVKDWPQGTCANAQDGKPGTAGGPLQVGHTYQ
jgi:hypothetical protein